MEKMILRGEYVAPEIDVMVIMEQGVLCQSPMGNGEDYSEGSELGW